MPETYRTGLPAIPHVTLTRRRDVMVLPAVRRSRHPLARPLRAAGEPRAGYVITGPGGMEIGVLVCVELGRRPRFAAVPIEGVGPPAAIEGRHAAAGSLVTYVVQRRLRAPRAAALAEARQQRARDRRPVDPFDAEALGSLTTV